MAEQSRLEGVARLVGGAGPAVPSVVVAVGVPRRWSSAGSGWVALGAGVALAVLLLGACARSSGSAVKALVAASERVRAGDRTRAERSAGSGWKLVVAFDAAVGSIAGTIG